MSNIQFVQSDSTTLVGEEPNLPVQKSKSIAQFHAELCNRIRKSTDEQILYRLRGICENQVARNWTQRALNLKPGDSWYEINTDTEFTMTE